VECFFAANNTTYDNCSSLNETSNLHQRKLHHISNSCCRAEEKTTSTWKWKLTFKYVSVFNSCLRKRKTRNFSKNKKKNIRLVFLIRFFSPWLAYYTAFLNIVSKILLSFPVRWVFSVYLQMKSKQTSKCRLCE